MSKTKTDYKCMIGKRIKLLRNEMNFSVKDLQRKSGVHFNTIYKLEKGLHSNVNVKSIIKVAESLNVGPDILMNPNLVDGIDYKIAYKKSPRAERKPIDDRDGYIIGDLNLYSPNKNIIAGVMEVSSERPTKLSKRSHPGEEFFFVLTGKINLYIGDKKIFLSKGDSITFSPEIPHSYACAKIERGETDSNKPSIGLSVIINSGYKTIKELHDAMENNAEDPSHQS